jgi:3-hydroxyacyl-CoA dehydrogenase
LFHAERLGLAHVLERVQAYAAGRAGWAWTPAPLLVRRANAGTGWQPA